MNLAHSRLPLSQTDLSKEECRDGWNWFHLGKKTPWGDETVRWVQLDDQKYSVNMIMDSTCRWLASGACHHLDSLGDKLYSSRLSLLWKVVPIWLVGWQIPTLCVFSDVVRCCVSSEVWLYCRKYYLPDLVLVGYQIEAETVVSSLVLLRGRSCRYSVIFYERHSRLAFSFALAWVPLL